jgi:cell division protein ZapA
MGQVNVTVNGRSYLVACDDGEETHVQDLARYLDKHVQDLAAAIGQVGETRLLLLAGLTLADELSEILARVDELTAELERVRAGRGSAKGEGEGAESAAAAALEAAARRIDDIARRLAAA